jgi:hypothetical protein
MSLYQPMSPTETAMLRDFAFHNNKLFYIGGRQPIPKGDTLVAATIYTPTAPAQYIVLLERRIYITTESTAGDITVQTRVTLNPTDLNISEAVPISIQNANNTLISWIFLPEFGEYFVFPVPPPSFSIYFGFASGTPIPLTYTDAGVQIRDRDITLHTSNDETAIHVLQDPLILRQTLDPGFSQVVYLFEAENLSTTGDCDYGIYYVAAEFTDAEWRYLTKKIPSLS